MVYRAKFGIVNTSNGVKVYIRQTM